MVCKKISSEEFSGLQPLLFLAKGAKLMLTMNLWPAVDLCNGATGIVVDISELKQQTFMIHERHGWPRRTGSSMRFKRQNQVLKQTNVKPRTPLVRKIRMKMSFKDLREFVFFRRKHDFRRRIRTFVQGLFFKETRI